MLKGLVSLVYGLVPGTEASMGLRLRQRSKHGVEIHIPVTSSGCLHRELKHSRTN